MAYGAAKKCNKNWSKTALAGLLWTSFTVSPEQPCEKMKKFCQNCPKTARGCSGILLCVVHGAGRMNSQPRGSRAWDVKRVRLQVPVGLESPESNQTLRSQLKST